MPRYKIYDNTTGKTLTVEGMAPPSESDATELFDQYFKGVPKSLLPVPGQQSTAAPTPTADSLPNDVTTHTGGGGPGFRPSTIPKLNTPLVIPQGLKNAVSTIRDWTHQPIASHLPQSAQDWLAKPAEFHDRTSSAPDWFKALHPGLVTPQTNPIGDILKGSAEKVSPDQIAALASMGVGGIPAVAANAYLGASGAAGAMDTSKSDEERLFELLNAAGGAAGALGSLPKAASQTRQGLEAISDWSKTKSAPTSALTSSSPIAARIAATKTPAELASLRHELAIAEFKAKYAGIEGTSADELVANLANKIATTGNATAADKLSAATTKARATAEAQAAALKSGSYMEEQQSLDNVLEFLRKRDAAKAASALKVQQAATKAEHEATTAASTTEHYDILAGDPKAKKAATEQARRLALARAQQAIDELRDKAIRGGKVPPRGPGGAPAYFTPVPSHAPKPLPVVPTPDEVAFGKPAGKLTEPVGPKSRPKPLPQEEAAIKESEALFDIIHGKDAPTPGIGTGPALSEAELAKARAAIAAQRAKAGVPTIEALAPAKTGVSGPAEPLGVTEGAKPKHAGKATIKEQRALDEALFRAGGGEPGAGVPAGGPVALPFKLTSNNWDAVGKALQDAKDAHAAAGKAGNIRVDAALRGVPAVQDLSPAQRSELYRQMAGLGKGAEAVDKADNLAQAAKAAKPDIDPSTLTSLVDPGNIVKAWKYPIVRALLGGTLGYNMGPDDEKMITAAVGALLGVRAAPRSMRGLQAAKPWIKGSRFESLLLGNPALATNPAGNVGGAIMAPILEAIRGNKEGAVNLLKQYLHPIENAKTMGRAIREEFRTKAPLTRFGKDIEAVGPTGRFMQGTDMGAKGIMNVPGMDPEHVANVLLSNNPNTALGKLTTQFLSHPLTEWITPFVRTRIKGLEMSAATSPLRLTSPITGGIAGSGIGYGMAPEDKKLKGALIGGAFGGLYGASPGGKNLSAMLPTEGAGVVKLLRELAMATPSVIAEEAGRRGYGPTSTAGMAALGTNMPAYAAGRGLRDYQKYGQDSPTDAANSVINQTPFAGDIPHITNNVEKFLASIPAQFLPQILMMIGDKTVRETGSTAPDFPTRMKEQVENALREKIPWLRTSLPARRDYSGKEMVRGWTGQYPPPPYETDPIAQRLAEAEPRSLLKREQSANLGRETPKQRLLDVMLPPDFSRTPPEELEAARNLEEALTSKGNETLTPDEESRIQELRGKMTWKVLGKMIASPNFQKLSKPAQDYFLETYKAKSIAAGTQYFRGERINEAQKALQK